MTQEQDDGEIREERERLRGKTLMKDVEGKSFDKDEWSDLVSKCKDALGSGAKFGNTAVKGNRGKSVGGEKQDPVEGE
jgi:hypothetical protein